MVSSSFLIELLLNGLVFGSMLTILTIGLSLIFGLLGVVNFAHGAFYGLGAYFAFVIISIGGNFWIALVSVPIIIGCLGLGIERIARRTYGMEVMDLTRSLTFFFALSIFIEDGTRFVWGSLGKQFFPPAELAKTIELNIIQFSLYRFFFFLLGVLVIIMVWLFLRKTSFGMIIRAGIQNKEMVQALGINISRVYMWTFALGVALASIAGIAYAPIVGVYPNMGMSVMILAFVVVVIGGMGSFKGSIVASFLVGLIYHLSILIEPRFSGVSIFLVLAFVLIVTKAGLFGELGR